MTTGVEKAKTKLQNKMAVLMIGIQLFTAAVVLFTVAYVFQFTTIANNGEALEKTLAMAALKIDAGQILKYDQTGEKDGEYEELYEYLSDIKVLDKINSIFIMTDQGDKYKYIIEGGRERAPGAVQKELGFADYKYLYGDQVQKAFDGGTSLHIGVYQSEAYQDVISAAAPIKDSRGRVVAVLYADMLKDIVVSSGQENLYQILPYVIGAVLITCLLIALIATFYIHRRVIVPIRTVSELAQELAIGRLDKEMPEKVLRQTDEIGVLSASYVSMAQSIRTLTGEIETLIEFALNGNFEKRADANKVEGGYREIMEDLNELLKLVANKTIFYETLLDAVSVPVAAINKEKKWSYINKAGAEAMKMKQADLVGLSCSKIGAPYCGTKDCVINQMEREGVDFVKAANFTVNGKTYKMRASKVYDKDGELFCYMETAEDITSEVRLEEYQREEIKRLSEGLACLADGNLHFELEEVGISSEENDAYVESMKKNFSLIRNNINTAVRSFRTYVTDISEKLTAMAYGDLDQEVTLVYRGDFVQVKDSLNTIITKFNDVINEIDSSANQVRMASGHVSAGSQSLAQATTEQVAASEEISATVDMVAERARENASNARKANSFVENARMSSKEGAEKMQEMIQAITEINRASGDISRIIKTIEDIAFQTNILALNAAVEAARAGQYGKGFGVVASEVRSLASKSAKAAKDTADLIESTVKKTGKGVAIAGKAAEAFDHILESIQEASSIVNGISEATNEQAISIAQISQGVEHVSEAALNNSNTAQQSAAASEELHTQADTLKTMIKLFNLKHHEGMEYAENELYEPYDHLREGSPTIALDQGEEDQTEEHYSEDAFRFKASDFNTF